MSNPDLTFFILKTIWFARGGHNKLKIIAEENRNLIDKLKDWEEIYE